MTKTMCVAIVATVAAGLAGCALLKNEKVTAWECARAETLTWFAENQFGVTPIGRPTDMKIGTNSVTFADGRLTINIKVALPEGASKDNPVPVFVFGSYIHPSAKQFDIPVARITERGYAYVSFNYNDICPNVSRPTGDIDRWADGVIAWAATGDPKTRNITRTPTSWGTIGAWAWGYSRVMDWIETRPELDATRVAIVGHSRGGKTALWAAAQDTRFAMSVSNNSGCGGARLNDMDMPRCEKIVQILDKFPNWFALNYAKWINRDREIAHDSDELLSLIAPRLCYVASAADDYWAGPAGEFESYSRARELWEAYGHPDGIGYHLRAGGHGLLPSDWEKFMNFADKHMR